MGPSGCLDLSIGILRSSLGDPEEQAVLNSADHSRPCSEELMHAYSCSFSCSLSQSDLSQTRLVMEERSQAQERPWDAAGSHLGGSSGQEHPLVGKVNPRKSSWWQYSLYSEPGSSSCQTMSFWRSCRRQRTHSGCSHTWRSALKESPSWSSQTTWKSWAWSAQRKKLFHSYRQSTQQKPK